MGGRRHRENILVAAQRLDGDGGTGSRARRRGGRTSVRVEGVGARVLRHDDLAARPLPLQQPPNASQQGDGPGDVLLVSSGTRSSPRRSFCPSRLLDLPPEVRDKKGITGILSF